MREAAAEHRLGVTFDSTHFADGGAVPIQLIVNDSGGSRYDVSISANAYNKIYIMGDSQFVNGASSEGDVLGIFSSGNMTPLPTTTDEKAAILSKIPTYTAFHTYTHGDPGEIGDCVATPGATAHYLQSSDITTAVASKSISKPPYNFVLLCACQCSGDATLATSFGISDSSVDTAFLGFITNVDNSNVTQGWAKTIWSDLKAGQKLSDALADARNKYVPMNVGSPANIKYYGDTNTTLAGTVYGGTPGQWAK